jgi:hypothetical protein
MRGPALKRLAILALATLSVLIFTACPYNAAVPLGDPRPHSVDARLLGLWTSIDPAGGEVRQIRVMRFNDAEYYVEYGEFGQEKKNPQREAYRAYSVTVGDEQFLNISTLKDDTAPPSHMFARHSLSDCNVLTLRFVGEKAIPSTLRSDQKGLLAFLETHLKDSALDDPDGPVVFHRAGADAVRPAGR